jgi:WD40 repeat protein
MIIDLDNKKVIPNSSENIESRIGTMAYANSTIFLGSDLGVIFSYNLGDFHQIEKHPCATGRDKDNLCIPDQPYSPILDLYASPDGKYILSGGSDNQAFIWYLDHQIIKNNRAAHRIILDSPATAVTGTYYHGNLLIGVGDSAGHISLYKILNEYSVSESDAINSATWATSIWDVSFSNNGSLIAITSNGGDAIIYKTSILIGEEKGDPILQIPPLSEDLFEKVPNKKISIAFSPNDVYFAIGAPGGVSIWGHCL